MFATFFRGVVRSAVPTTRLYGREFNSCHLVANNGRRNGRSIPTVNRLRAAVHSRGILISRPAKVERGLRLVIKGLRLIVNRLRLSDVDGIVTVATGQRIPRALRTVSKLAATDTASIRAVGVGQGVTGPAGIPRLCRRGRTGHRKTHRRHRQDCPHDQASLRNEFHKPAAPADLRPARHGFATTSSNLVLRS